MSLEADTIHYEMEIGELSLEAALSSCGWVIAGPMSWKLPTSKSRAFLVDVGPRDQWRQFHLRGGLTPQSSNSRVLHDNRGLFGPAKFVAGPSNCPICRLDVPNDLTGATGAAFAIADNLCVVDANLLWARAVTRVATGIIQQAESPAGDDTVISAMADEIKQAGWSVSHDDGQLLIHLQLPGIYRQIALIYDDRSGVTFTVELVELTDQPDDCFRAALVLLQQANTRLPLARMTVVESPKSISLRAEVSFGSTFIGGSFLLQSLHVIETAVRLLARELEALRDVELTRLVLAASTNFSVNHTQKGD